MRKRTRKILILVIVITATSFYAIKAFGLDTMGPPSAGLKKGHFGAGVDYSDTKMNLSLENGTIVDELYQFGALAQTTTTKVSSFTIKNLKMHKTYANIGYGVTDNIEGFIRFGKMNTEFSGNLFPTTASQSREYNGNSGYAFGFGAKVTVYEKDKLKLGGLFQMSRASSEATLSYGSSSKERVELDIREIQIAVGPTYQLTSNLVIYGGPFWHFVNFGGSGIDGKKDPTIDPSQAEQKISYASYDIGNLSYFGGYIGAQLEFLKDTFYCIEYQHTADADAVAMSVRWKF
jgi:hypothetical protein